MIHDAEAEVEFCKLHIIKATELLAGLRLQLREQQSENTGGQFVMLENKLDLPYIWQTYGQGN